MLRRALPILTACWLAPATLRASPWTLPHGTLVLGGSFHYQLATTEFFDPGEAQFDGSQRRAQALGGERRFPLDGRYLGAGFTLAARYGVTDRLELEFTLPLRIVSYESDPVILLARPSGSTDRDLDYYQRNVINLSQAASGIGDLGFAARYNLTRAPVALAGELRLKIPPGYRGPAGTFGESPTSVAALVAAPARFLTPGNVRDDVTLGDGQVDVTASALLGYAFPTRTFVRLDLGYNLRFEGAADQVVGALRVGQQFGDVLVYLSSQGVLSVQQGRVIGVSVAASDPALPAADYDGLTNLLLREVQLRRSALDVGGGVILRLSRELELNAAYARTLWGVNTAATNSLFVGFALRTELLAAQR